MLFRISAVRPSIFNSILYATNPSNSGKPSVSIGATVEIGQEAAKEISQGISSLGSNIGLSTLR